ncbi:MAG: ATP phosphoribosyltransferase regulatory subunit [Hyphomicrobium sp.]
MTAETAKQFEALEAQATRIMQVFSRAGYEAVSPALIQPAGVFLDVIGEALRARTYVFTDPDGDELCLRPDLTVPACRLHLERNSAPETPARYCYNGAAFRFQPQGADTAHPREFRQAGIESFGGTDAEQAEAETVATMLEALKSAGLNGFQMRFGDLGMFSALLRSVDIPERWRQRLRHHFWRPEAFRAELQRLTEAPAGLMKSIPASLNAALDPDDPAASEAAVQAYLDSEGIDVIGVRPVSEITANLLAQVADGRADPLSPTTSRVIERYINLRITAGSAALAIKDLAREEGVDVADALQAYQRRLELLRRAGVDIENAEFSAEFGRTLEYYTGFVFEVFMPTASAFSPIAGGGRYDSLMKAVGAVHDVPAVGAAIHTERLLAAAGGRP